MNPNVPKGATASIYRGRAYQPGGKKAAEKAEGKLTHTAVNALLDTVRNQMHRQIQSDDNGNVGVDAANRLSESSEETDLMVLMEYTNVKLPSV